MCAYVQTLLRSTVLGIAFSLCSGSLNYTFCVSITARPPDHPGKERRACVEIVFLKKKLILVIIALILAGQIHHSLHSSLDDRCRHDRLRE